MRLSSTAPSKKSTPQPLAEGEAVEQLMAQAVPAQKVYGS